jgi:hypothetical protein
MKGREMGRRKRKREGKRSKDMMVLLIGMFTSWSYYGKQVH